jgi:hypothetical protein
MWTRRPGAAAGGRGWTWTTRPASRASPAGRRRRCRRRPPPQPPSRQEGTGARCSTPRRPDPPPLSPPLYNRLVHLNLRDPIKLPRCRTDLGLDDNDSRHRCHLDLDPPRTASVAYCNSLLPARTWRRAVRQRLGMELSGEGEQQNTEEEAGCRHARVAWCSASARAAAPRLILSPLPPVFFLSCSSQTDGGP